MTTASSSLLVSFVAAATMLASAAPPARAATASDEVTALATLATGFNNPRGLKFDDDGHLYVAEGGVGGSLSTAGLCTQVVPPVGPYTGSPTGGRISRVLPSGWRETITDNLPSSMTSPGNGSSVQGAADIAFVGGHLYALLGGAGCSHGVADIPNGVVEVHPKTGRWSMIADLSAFQQANPTQVENPADFEPDGVWYSMISVGGALYAVEPNHGELDRIGVDGSITRIADISASQGHVVPTVVAWHDGAFYVGELGVYPIVAGSAQVLRITMDGNVQVYAGGFSDITGLTFDAAGRLYVLENAVGNPFPVPATGDIVRVDAQGRHKVIASQLNFPTYLAYFAGSLYVSDNGYGEPPTGLGEVLRIGLK